MFMGVDEIRIEASGNRNRLGFDDGALDGIYLDYIGDAEQQVKRPSDKNIPSFAQGTPSPLR